MDQPLYFDTKIKLCGRSITIAVTEHFLVDTLCKGKHLHYHAHPGYELQYITGGEGHIRVEGEIYPISAGEVLLIPPNLRHTVLWEGTHLRRITFLFFPSEGDGSREDAYFTQALRGVTGYLSTHSLTEAEHLIGQLQQELQHRDPLYLQRVNALFTAFMIDLVRYLYSAPQPECAPLPEALPRDVDENRAQQIEDYLTAHYTGSGSSVELASQLYMSERQLERILNRLYGKPFRQLVLEMRMDMANYLLEETSLSMEQIAEQLGYSSVNAFYLAYRKIAGFPPGQKRKKSRENS